MKKIRANTKIIETLTSKSTLKQQIYDNTCAAFRLLKNELFRITEDLNGKLADEDPRVQLRYVDHGEFTAELKVAGDLLIFSMHSNIFQFDRDHEIWKTEYIKDDPSAGYSGVINMYNFLSDSFKYNRMEDVGYLVARIFINKNNHFFVQGKRQSGFNYTTLGANVLDQQSIQEIVKASVQYCLDFDLLVPPYEAVKLVTVGQIHQNISDAKQTTGKRLGFQFKVDDVDR
ncbi:MAG: hypothetical protein D4R64_13630 [Porphyromonadaceae bacterium]|nr:MAG: hypothetical protein D4R64_13630 [Porphyromonadaceae bacterium]